MRRACQTVVLLIVVLASIMIGSAQGRRTDNRVDGAVQSRVLPFRVDQAQLLDSPFKAAMERNAKYLLELDADRLLHNTRKYAGLQPKGALYGGWEARGVAGHTLGHYLTALSQQYAATDDIRFRERIAYIIREMAECQRAYGDGYIGALPPLELQTLRGFKQGKVDVDGGFNFKGGAWVPWYTEHKVLAGLKDAWVLAHNAQAKQVTRRAFGRLLAVVCFILVCPIVSLLASKHSSSLSSKSIRSARMSRAIPRASKAGGHSTTCGSRRRWMTRIRARSSGSRWSECAGEGSYIVGDENSPPIATSAQGAAWASQLKPMWAARACWSRKRRWIG